MLTLAGVLALLLGVILLAVSAKLLLDGTAAFLIPLVPGICALAFGAAAFLNPGLIVAFMAVILGFACLAGGLVTAGAGIFRQAHIMQRILTFASGFLLAALGVLVLLCPQGAAGLTIRLAGLILAAAGVTLLAEGIRSRPARDPLEDPEFRVIEER